LSHNGGINFFDFSIFAEYYKFDCHLQNCGSANLEDCDDTVDERDLAILVADWLAGV